MKDELTKAVSRNILNNVFSLLNTLYIYMYICTVYLCGNKGHLTWLALILVNFLEITKTRFT